MTGLAAFVTGAPSTPAEAERRPAELAGPAELGSAGQATVALPPEGADVAYVWGEAPGALARNPDLWLYRDRTVGLLRRYLRMAIEVGRLPSLVGREFFRTRVTSYRASSFEDSVIFVHDIERSLENLDEFDKKLIAKIVLQEYSQEEAAGLLGCGHRTVNRLYPEALDRVSEIFLERKILTRLPDTKPKPPESCQEGKTSEFPVSDSMETK
jgi:predicted DNA-binding protein (UPF0251 family)